ncbi:MAG TPA: M14 family metallopeptidase [Methylocystis sp.]|nr:M14 family metallopeptidase [Methylocystis sp.]
METPCAVLDRVPPEFLDCPPERLIKILPRPTLFDLKGRDPRPLFVSVLLHGDEETGLEAAQELLRRHLAKGLSRSLLLFVGNVEAAAASVRTLPSQRDFNRIWPGTSLAQDPFVRMAQFVFDYAARRPLFASLDIHNNTGANPHYVCVSRLEPKFLALARLFSRTVVHSERPLGVRTAAFTRLCPSVTVECGKVGEGKARDHAIELLEACLSIAELPDHPPAPQDLNLLRSYAIVRVPPAATLSFDGAPADFMFAADLDHLNFSELSAGTTFGRLGNGGGRLELASGEGDEGTPAGYFDYVDGEIRLARAAIPAMLTTKPAAVRQDCLCYLMHRINMQGERL